MEEARAPVQGKLTDPVSDAGPGASAIMRNEARSDPDASQDRSGFALIIVLWITALVSLLAIGIIWPARLNVQTAGNIQENARAEALANGGVALVKLVALQALPADSRSRDGAETAERPKAAICAMPGDALAAIAVESNAGKVDLNIASADDLEGLLRAVGADRSEARALARSIVEFRSVSGVTEPGDPDPAPWDKAHVEPKRALFETVLELDQVEGMQPEWLHALLPYVTASARATEFDSVQAPPLLQDVLLETSGSGSGALAASVWDIEPMGDSLRSLFGAAGHGATGFLVHVEVATKGGGYFVREANILVTGGADPAQIVEWRQGRRRYFDVLSRASRGLASRRVIYRRCDGQD